MYHRNVIPFFVVFSIAVLVVIVLGSFWMQEAAPRDFQISTSSPALIIPQTAPPPSSSDPLITPGPSQTQ